MREEELKSAFEKVSKADEDLWKAYYKARDKFFFEVFSSEERKSE